MKINSERPKHSGGFEEAIAAYKTNTSLQDQGTEGLKMGGISKIIKVKYKQTGPFKGMGKSEQQV